MSPSNQTWSGKVAVTFLHFYDLKDRNPSPRSLRGRVQRGCCVQRGCAQHVCQCCQKGRQNLAQTHRCFAGCISAYPLGKFLSGRLGSRLLGRLRCSPLDTRVFGLDFAYRSGNTDRRLCPITTLALAAVNELYRLMTWPAAATHTHTLTHIYVVSCHVAAERVHSTDICWRGERTFTPERTLHVTCSARH